MDEPERRWRQHRAERTGPFKASAPYAEWRILEPHVSLANLDELESYYIGLHDAHSQGHNSNCGNHREAYQRGLHERRTKGRAV